MTEMQNEMQNEVCGEKKKKQTSKQKKEKEERKAATIGPSFSVLVSFGSSHIIGFPMSATGS